MEGFECYGGAGAVQAKFLFSGSEDSEECGSPRSSYEAMEEGSGSESFDGSWDGHMVPGEQFREYRLDCSQFMPMDLDDDVEID